MGQSWNFDLAKNLIARYLNIHDIVPGPPLYEIIVPVPLQDFMIIKFLNATSYLVLFCW